MPPKLCMQEFHRERRFNGRSTWPLDKSCNRIESFAMVAVRVERFKG
jgi:hypothetical protein